MRDQEEERRPAREAASGGERGGWWRRLLPRPREVWVMEPDGRLVRAPGQRPG